MKKSFALVLGVLACSQLGYAGTFSKSLVETWINIKDGSGEAVKNRPGVVCLEAETTCGIHQRSPLKSCLDITTDEFGQHKRQFKFLLSTDWERDKNAEQSANQEELNRNGEKILSRKSDIKDKLNFMKNVRDEHFPVLPLLKNDSTILGKRRGDCSIKIIGATLNGTPATQVAAWPPKKKECSKTLALARGCIFVQDANISFVLKCKKPAKDDPTEMMKFMQCQQAEAKARQIRPLMDSQKTPDKNGKPDTAPTPDYPKGKPEGNTQVTPAQP